MIPTVVGTLLGVLLGYLLGRGRRLKVSLYTPPVGTQAPTDSYGGQYPRQAVSWSGATEVGTAGDGGRQSITFDEMTRVSWQAWSLPGDAVAAPFTRTLGDAPDSVG
jgi:hypothetical protein